MSKNLGRGLAVGAGLIILLVVLYVLYKGRPLQPGPVVAPAPPVAGPAVKPEPAPPAVGVPSPPSAPPPAPPAAEVSPPGPPVTVLPPAAPEEQYGLQVGKYRQYRAADRMLARLKKRGVPGFIRRAPGQRRPYQVWAGPFATLPEGREAEKALRSFLRKVPPVQKIPASVPK